MPNGKYVFFGGTNALQCQINKNVINGLRVCPLCIMSHVASLHTLAARRPAAVMSCSLVCCVAVPSFKGVMLQLRSGMAADVMLAVAHVPIAVSYTHLTLPTIYSV